MWINLLVSWGFDDTRFVMFVLVVLVCLMGSSRRWKAPSGHESSKVKRHVIG